MDVNALVPRPSWAKVREITDFETVFEDQTIVSDSVTAGLLTIDQVTFVSADGRIVDVSTLITVKCGSQTVEIPLTEVDDVIDLIDFGRRIARNHADADYALELAASLVPGQS